MKIGLIVFLLIGLTAFSVSTGAKYTLDNEKVIYSFVTQNGQTLTLCKDTADKYIVYRFGTKDEIQLEFPQKKDKDSWTKFKYSYWLRGGGVMNEGIDLNYVAFINGGFKYIIYDTYLAHGDIYTIGIKVFDAKGVKAMDLKGDLKTRRGTLGDFRGNKLIQEGDELYD